MKKLIPVLLILLLIVAGCGGNNFNNKFTAQGKGWITLNIETLLTAKTITPDVKMTPTYYNISGTGPSGASLTRNGITNRNVLLENLVPGGWTIVVDAFNEDNIRIGSGIKNVTVVANYPVDLTVEVRPINGSGTLTIDLDWTGYTVGNPVIAATLTPKGGIGSPLTFTVKPDGTGATYSGSQLTGYYTLVVLMRDGSSFKWGAAEAVRILDGQTSPGSYKIEIPTGLGNINLTIVDELQNPIAVEITGGTGYLGYGNDMTLTATTSETVDRWQWYIDGTPIAGATTATLTYGSTLGIGKHRLDLIVEKDVSENSIISSTSVEFTISTSHDIWASKANISTPDLGMGAASWNGKVYKFGGYYYGNEVKVYDPVADEWTSPTSLSIIRCEPEVVELGGLIYVMGGYGQYGWSAADTVDIYNPANNTWSSGAPMPLGKAGAAVAVAYGKIYVFGGYNGGPVYNDVAEYNPVADSWTQKTAVMSTTRWRTGAVTINNLIYVFGGAADAGGGPSVASVEIYDPLTDSFTPGPALPFGCSGFGVHLVNGKIYLISSYSATTGVAGDVLELDPANTQWVPKTKMPSPRWVFGSAELNGQIYCIGGEGNLGAFEVYTP
jgi:N-acetylneuraminic acid mutarotase